MYLFDKNVFVTLGNYYPNRFPTIWGRIDALAEKGTLCSVREVQREIETNCPYEFIAEWVKQHHSIFLIPSDAELIVVTDIFKKEQYRGLVKKTNIIKGLPVADPFIVAAGVVYGACVVTQESLKQGGARIPTLCQELQVRCTDLEGFLENENLLY